MARFPSVLDNLPELRILRLSGNEFYREALEDEFGCASGGAVPNPYENTGLVADCNTLLGLKDELRGTQSLNWSADLPLSDWSGVTLSMLDYERRVTALVFFSWDLNGRIPAALSKLDKLEQLSLTITKLTGPIPPELAKPS